MAATATEKGQQTRAENAIRRALRRRGFVHDAIRRVPGGWYVQAVSLDDEIVLSAPDYKGILALIEAY